MASSRVDCIRRRARSAALAAPTTSRSSFLAIALSAAKARSADSCTRSTAIRSRSNAGSSRTRATGSAPKRARRPAAIVPESSELIDAFCDQVWLQNGLAASSLASYRRDLAAWAAWLDRRGGTLLAAQRADVDAFLADQFRAKAKATSVS